MTILTLLTRKCIRFCVKLRELEFIEHLMINTFSINLHSGVPCIRKYGNVSMREILFLVMT